MSRGKPFPQPYKQPSTCSEDAAFGKASDGEIRKSQETKGNILSAQAKLMKHGHFFPFPFFEERLWTWKTECTKYYSTYSTRVCFSILYHLDLQELFPQGIQESLPALLSLSSEMEAHRGEKELQFPRENKVQITTPGSLKQIGYNTQHPYIHSYLSPSLGRCHSSKSKIN